jgi:hypothetical protein
MVCLFKDFNYDLDVQTGLGFSQIYSLYPRTQKVKANMILHQGGYDRDSDIVWYTE